MLLRRKFDEYCVRRADEIRKRQKKEELGKRENTDARAKNVSKMYYVMRNILTEKARSMEEYECCHIKTGDKIILNKYSLGVDGYNKYDGGPSALLGNCKSGPITGTAVCVSVSMDYISDLIEEYLNDKSFEWIEYNIGAPPNDIYHEFEKYAVGLKKRTIGNTIGLYWKVSFKLDNEEFNPAWGLNANSWLCSDTDAGKDTLRLWSLQCGIDEQLTALVSAKSASVAEVAVLREKYKKSFNAE